eukprot:SAG31_NODE_10298_length_1158_cov_1.654391_1_plen_111_part_10
MLGAQAVQARDGTHDALKRTRLDEYIKTCNDVASSYEDPLRQALAGTTRKQNRTTKVWQTTPSLHRLKAKVVMQAYALSNDKPLRLTQGPTSTAFAKLASSLILQTVAWQC